MEGLVEQKREYIKLLCGILAVPLYQGISSICDVAKDTKKSNRAATKDVLTVFQELLKGVVPKWTPSVLEKEAERIRSCGPRGKHIVHIFRAILKSSIIIQTQKTDFRQMQFVTREHYEQPSLEEFIHQCYLHVSRAFHNNPFLFCPSATGERAKANQREAIEIIKDCVEEAVRHFLPLEEMLREYLEQPSDNESTFTNKVSLLKEDGESRVENVFSTYNIQEQQPGTPPATVLTGGSTVDAAEPGSVLATNHSITNFLMDDPRLIRSESFAQSPIQSQT